MADKWTFDTTEKRDVPACVLCGRNGPKLLSKIDRYRHVVDTVACRRCGIAWLTPQPTPGSYAEFYRSGVYRQMLENLTGNGTPMMDRVVEAQKIYGALLWREFSAIAKRFYGRNVIDLAGGCGTIGALFAQKLHAPRLTVVEESEDECAYARKAFGCDIVCGDVQANAIGKVQDFEGSIVLLIQAIDHFTNPIGVLKQVRALNPALLLIDIVNFPVMFQHGSYRACKIDHPYNWHNAGMQTALRSSGWEIMHNHLLRERPKVIYACTPGEAVMTLPGPAFVSKVFELYRNAKA